MEKLERFVNFDEWLEMKHPEIEAMERKQLCDEANPNTPEEFLDTTPSELFIEVEMAAGRSDKCNKLLAEWVRYFKMGAWQRNIERYMKARGLSHEEAERELSKPRVAHCDPPKDSVH